MFEGWLNRIQSESVEHSGSFRVLFFSFVMDSPDPTRPGSRSSSNDEEASIHPERPGIFGLETELAVVYLPTDESEVDVAPEEIPSFEIQERVLFECLLEGRKAAHLLSYNP